MRETYVQGPHIGDIAINGVVVVETHVGLKAKRERENERGLLSERGLRIQN